MTGLQRRSFRRSAAALAAAPGAAASGGAGNTIREAPRTTPVVLEVDVLAAAEGARVPVVERHGMLDSVWTAEVMNPFFDSEKGWTVTKLIDYHALITETIVVSECVRGAIVESKSGREAVLAKVSIGWTGDGDLAARAGVPVVLGREKDGLEEPASDPPPLRSATRRHAVFDPRATSRCGGHPGHADVQG